MATVRDRGHLDINGARELVIERARDVCSPSREPLMDLMSKLDDAIEELDSCIRERHRKGLSDKTDMIMTAVDAAEYLDLNPYSLRHMAARGEVPGRKVGGVWRFSREQLHQFVRGEI